MIDEEYEDPSQYAWLIASLEARRRQSLVAATAAATTGSAEEFVPNFPVLVSQTVIIPYAKTHEGQLIRAATFPLDAIIERILKEPSLMYEVDPRKWEEIIAATYDASGLFDEVTLTPRSGDGGRDVIAVKKGFGSVRLIESVKRYTPGTKTTAEEARALLGVLLSDPQASKGMVSTTWEFAPKILENPQIKQYVPSPRTARW
jgi:restriction system protein